MDERSLADFLDALPSTLAVWHDGPDALPRLLVTSIAEGLREEDALRRLTAQQGGGGDPRQSEMRDRWRHTTASLVEWHSMFGRPVSSMVPATVVGPAPKNRAAAKRQRRHRTQPRSVRPEDYLEAVRLASDWWVLDPVRVGLRAGDISVAGSGSRHIRLHNSRRADIEVLDILLEQVTVAPALPGDPARLVAPAPGFGREPVDPLVRWIQDHALPPTQPDDPLTGTRMGSRHPAAHHVVNAIPRRLVLQVWERTEEELRSQGTTLAEDTDLGGLSLAVARTCYAYLITQLNVNHAAAVLLGTPEMFLWAIQPAQLLRALRARVSDTEARAFLDLCTHVPGRSPVSAPLLPHRHQLLIPDHLVSPVAFERTLLRAASSNPDTAGRLGNILGGRGDRWQQRLSTIPACRVAAGVGLRDTQGRSAGDLDVVAWDPAAGVTLVVEAKWPVDAATLAESFKVDATFDKGRSQLSRVRAGLEDGAIVAEWPRDWHDDPLRSGRVHWWVGSATQLDSRPPCQDDITTTSLRLVESLLPARDLDDLVRRMRDLQLPRRDVEFTLVPRTVRAGHLTLTLDTIAIAADVPTPPPDRRVHLGWT